MDGVLRIWDLESGVEVRSLKGHGADAVFGLAVLPGGRRAVSAGDDRSVRLWDLETGRELAAFHGDAAFSCCTVLPTSRRVVVGDALGGMHWLEILDP
jgi:WD40 repeat protein